MTVAYAPTNNSTTETPQPTETPSTSDTPPTDPQNPPTTTQTDGDPNAQAQQFAAEKLNAIDGMIGQAVQKAPAGSAIQAAYKEYMENDNKLDHYERVALVHMFKAGLGAEVFDAFVKQVAPICQELGVNLGQEELKSASNSGPQIKDGSVGGLARYNIDQEYNRLKQQHVSNPQGQTQLVNDRNTSQQPNSISREQFLAWASQHKDEIEALVNQVSQNASPEIRQAAVQFLTTGQDPELASLQDNY
jgi:hypothetical protein